MLDASFEHIRNHDEPSPVNHGSAAKSGNRISPAKSAAVPQRFSSATPPPVRRSRLELSLTQILGSTSAAVTAAFLGSRLGVAGTLIGAALASVISVVGGAIYTSSLKATRQRVAQAIVAARGSEADHPGPPPPVVVPVRPGALQSPEIRPSRGSAVQSLPDRKGRPVPSGVAIGALLSAAVFAGAIGIVTGYETVSGTALSGGRSGGLTILGGQQVGSRDSRIGTPTRPSVTVPGSAGETTAASGTPSPTPHSAVTTPSAPTTGSQTTGGSSATSVDPTTSGATTTRPSTPGTGTTADSTDPAGTPTPGAQPNSVPVPAGGSPVPNQPTETSAYTARNSAR